MGTHQLPQQKQRVEYGFDKATYEAFTKACSRKGFAPQVIIEKMMQRFIETGQI